MRGGSRTNRNYTALGRGDVFAESKVCLLIYFWLGLFLKQILSIAGYPLLNMMGKCRHDDEGYGQK